MYKRKDKVIFKSTKTKDSNVQWVRETGTILEIIVIEGHTAYNIQTDDGIIESVLVSAVESKV